MPGPTIGKSTLWLCLRFVVLAPICLVLWLLALPAYTWILGHATAAVLKYVFRTPIDSVIITREGFLNTGTQLTYVIGEQMPTMNDVGHLVTNVAPFIALVLATSGLGWLRRLKILGIGIGIIFLSHGATIILRFVAGRTTLPTAIGFISITLPFLLWIVLAYWDSLLAYFGDGDEAEAHEPPAPTP
jgi:hypothetical protein